MTLLSVNINKFALIRNSRGDNKPNLIDVTQKCIKYGAKGITVHPRPDQRHVKFEDLLILSKLIRRQYPKTEFNIEGYPSKKFCEIVKNVKPDQVTLVPDPPQALTSSFGWDCLKFKSLLLKVVKDFQKNNIRVSLFINPSKNNLKYLDEIRPERVELYTYEYARNYFKNKNKAIKKYVEVYKYLKDNFPFISLNAGHDLNLDNLGYLLKNIPIIQEVSIGHALVCDSFEYGLKKTIKKYSNLINKL